ncbi:exopolysaccharide production protein YjbE [Pantoea sp. App145]|uniref:exopolysaccharide production protein YjbE n=1 Tax=Pantoea sp. App145 TaxID=3071567 RepID=UPI003A805F60
MKITAITTLLLAGMLSLNANAADPQTGEVTTAQNTGAAAGDTATSFAQGNSVVIGVSTIGLLAGVALATSNNGGSNTSTTTTTTTTGR